MQVICSQLPSTLQHLTLPPWFNSSLSSPLPNSLTYLKFGRCFDQQHFPYCPNLRYLEFGDKYNRPLLSLPPFLTHLIFGKHFNQTLSSLPPILRTLFFAPDSHFNHLLPPLPDSLTRLSLGDHYDCPLPCPLPTNLTHLILGKIPKHPMQQLPTNIEEFRVGGSHLEFQLLMTEGDDENEEHGANNIEPSLNFITHLHLNGNGRAPIPPRVKFLDISGYYDWPLPQLPLSLTNLTLATSFNQQVFLPLLSTYPYKCFLD